MRLILRAALALAIGLAAAGAPRAQDSAGSDGRVVGGRPAEKGAWPWQVKIYAADPQQRGRSAAHCGGSVIAPNWVLTAAHCFVSGSSGRQSLTARDIILVAGETELPRSFVAKAGDRRLLRARNVVLHPQFDIRTFTNDVALVELDGSTQATPVALPGEASASSDLAGVSAVVTGWGFTTTAHGFDASQLPTALQEAELPVVSIPACRQAYADSTMRAYSLDGRNLCAGFQEGGRDACQGDSGGPLVARTATGWAQVGIVSWGEGCAERNRYGVYTRVAAFEGWIRSATGGAPGPAVPPAAVQSGAPPAAASGPPAAAQPAQATSGPQFTAQDAIAALVPSGQAPAEAQPAPPVAAPPAAAGPSATPAPTAPEPAVSDARGDRALLIGIDAYPGQLRLVGSTNDVKAEYKLLTETLGFKPAEIMTLTDEKATRAGILAAIDDWLIKGSKPGSRVFIHFSGHGFQAKDENGDEDDGLDETLVPVDVELVRGPSGKVTDVRNQIIDDEIAARMAKLHDRRVTAVFDSCHSGTVTRDVGGSGMTQADLGYVRSLEAVLDLDEELTRKLASPRRSLRAATPKSSFVERIDDAVVWSAVAEDQLALVDRTAAEPMGVFTRRFVDGVRARAGKDASRPTRSLVQLLDYVRAQSSAYCDTRPELCKAGLTPQLEAPPSRLGDDVVTGNEPVSTPDAVQATLGGDNPAGVSIEILPGDDVAVGQKIAFRVQAKKQGYLVLIDVDASGKLTQIWPNRHSMATPKGEKPTANLLKAGKVLTVPDMGNPFAGFEYVAEPPSGRGMVVAVMSDQPVQVIDLPDMPVTLGGQRAALDYVYRLAQSLRITPADEAGRIVQPKWSFASKPYTIR
jgi:secreted trypsin-like serine protease